MTHQNNFNGSENFRGKKFNSGIHLQSTLQCIMSGPSDLLTCEITKKAEIELLAFFERPST